MKKTKVLLDPTERLLEAQRASALRGAAYEAVSKPIVSAKDAMGRPFTFQIKGYGYLAYGAVLATRSLLLPEAKRRASFRLYGPDAQAMLGSSSSFSSYAEFKAFLKSPGCPEAFRIYASYTALSDKRLWAIAKRNFGAMLAFSFDFARYYDEHKTRFTDPDDVRAMAEQRPLCAAFNGGGKSSYWRKK